MTFRDRKDAGRQLAALLQRFKAENPLVLALPRGGVPVAREVANALNAPLEVFVSRKLGAPGQPELGVGAIAEGGAVYIDARAARLFAISPEELSQIAEREAVELERRAHLYRRGMPLLPRVAGHTVILVDDGIATGVTARAAIRALRELHPQKLVLAAPVVAAGEAEQLRAEVDALVFVEAPREFGAVGFWYDSFPQTTDEEVLSLLGRGAAETHPEPPRDPEPVHIPCGAGVIEGLMAIPGDAWGAVLFAGGARRPGRYVARVLQYAGIATVQLDLLPESLEVPRRIDIDLLAERLIAATRWTENEPRLHHLPLGYFGAGTGAAAALVAAAQQPQRLEAIVCRGGRPDLAGATNLVRVEVPTLLIAGGADTGVVEVNEDALRFFTTEHKLVIVPGASHLFEEPGALDSVARLAADWFATHLLPVPEFAWPEGRPP